jgi:ubiquinone/menaquinone biosynthesis C-methylase UbiE
MTVRTQDVAELYNSARGDLFQLVFGEQIHIGGFDASLALADRAGILPGQRGVDLCCCNGAGMRFLVRFREVAGMTGVDISERVIARGRARCDEEGLSERIRFVHADACASGLDDASADFVWSEDAWVYVPDKPRLIEEAARIVKRDGIIAFTDWVEGPAGLSDAEREPLFAALTFPNLQTIEGYRGLLEKAGCEVTLAEDTGAFARSMDLAAELLETQHKYDALRLVGWNEALGAAVSQGFRGMADLARADKIQQGRFVARRR